MWWIRLAYDGTDFSGACELPGERTVAGELREALARFGVREAAIDVLARTDAGVHARDAVITLDACDGRDSAWLLTNLARHLPDDIRPTSATHATRPPRVLAKTYRYTLDTSALGCVWLARYAWRTNAKLEALNQAAACVVGRVDFAAFRRRGETRNSLERTITRCEWQADNHALHSFVSGEGFPLHGVRALVGGMVHVAQGHASLDVWRAALNGKPHAVARQGAPARGLCLWETVIADELAHR